MAERRLITDRSLKALAPAPSGKRVELFDTRVPGFGVRISDTEDSNPARRGKAGKLTFILYARLAYLAPLHPRSSIPQAHESAYAQ